MPSSPGAVHRRVTELGPTARTIRSVIVDGGTVSTVGPAVETEMLVERVPELPETSEHATLAVCVPVPVGVNVRLNEAPDWAIVPWGTLSQENAQEDTATLSFAVALKLVGIPTVAFVGPTLPTVGGVVSTVLPVYANRTRACPPSPLNVPS
jgi:hypothetical protein